MPWWISSNPRVLSSRWIEQRAGLFKLEYISQIPKGGQLLLNLLREDRQVMMPKLADRDEGDDMAAITAFGPPQFGVLLPVGIDEPAAHSFQPPFIAFIVKPAADLVSAFSARKHPGFLVHTHPLCWLQVFGQKILQSPKFCHHFMKNDFCGHTCRKRRNETEKLTKCPKIGNTNPAIRIFPDSIRLKVGNFMVGRIEVC